MPHSARTDSRPAAAGADVAPPVHGDLTLPAVTIESYSLEVRDSETDGFYGDRASRTAFGKMLDLWRTLFTEMNDGKDAFGAKPTAEIGKRRLDELLAQNGSAAAAIRAASEDSRHLCERLPWIGGHPTHVRLHDDAVVQGLSELPFMNDVERWAVLTVGTGLGNASFTNR